MTKPNQAAIQRAHDVLHAVAIGQPAVHDRDGAIAAHAAHDALAWILGFPCGKAFRDNLAETELAIEAAGYEPILEGRLK